MISVSLLQPYCIIYNNYRVHSSFSLVENRDLLEDREIQKTLSTIYRLYTEIKYKLLQNMSTWFTYQLLDYDVLLQYICIINVVKQIVFGVTFI